MVPPSTIFKVPRFNVKFAITCILIFLSSLFKVSFSASVSIVSLFCQNNAIQLIGILLVLDLLKMTLIDSRLSLN